MHQPLSEEQKAAVSDLRPANDLNGATNNALFHQFEDMTSAAAEAARNYRSWMLDQMKINMCAALNYANGLASVSPGGSAARPGTQGADRAAPAVTKVADEYCAKAFKLASANISSTLDYAQRLVHVKTPAEFVELSTDHARRQFELFMKQTVEFAAAQSFAMPNIEAMTAGFAKALRERKEGTAA